MWWPPTTRSFRCSDRGRRSRVTDVEVYVGDEANPRTTCIDFTLNRGREGPRRVSGKITLRFFWRMPMEATTEW